MNLLLHGLEYPEIEPLNALRFPLREPLQVGADVSRALVAETPIFLQRLSDEQFERRWELGIQFPHLDQSEQFQTVRSE
jgi:hypothetical protein